jgi:hypothetical protein
MFSCTACNYSTANKHYFTKHQNTKKHLKLQQANEATTTNNNTTTRNITINIIGETISIYKPSKLYNILSEYVDLDELSKPDIKQVRFTSSKADYRNALERIVRNEKYIERFETKLNYLDLAIDINKYKINQTIIKNLAIIIFVIEYSK